MAYSSDDSSHIHIYDVFTQATPQCIPSQDGVVTNKKVY